MKKFVCSVCGYIHEGNEAPEKCPLCKVGADKFNEVVETEALTFVTEHKLGDGKVENEEIVAGLNEHFIGECTEERVDMS
jgi:rubrerythrin